MPRRFALLALAAILLSAWTPVAPEALRSVVGSGELVAQADGVLPLALQLPASGRAMALGEAYAMDSGHAEAVFYHPALLAGAEGIGLGLQRWGSSATGMTAAGAFPWFDGGVGIGVRTLQLGAPGPGAAAAPGGQDHLFRTGPDAVSETVATVGYGREVVGDLRVGIAGHFVDERIGPVRNAVTLLDVGVARPFGDLLVGLTARGIGEKPVVDSGAGPSSVTLGVGGYGRPVGPLDLGFAARFGLADDEVTWGGGLEVGYWPIQGRTFVARIGLQDVPDGSDAGPLTTGFAFWGDDLIVEWAFVPVSGADEGGTHRIGIGWR